MSLFNEFKNYILFAFASYWSIKASEYFKLLGISDGWLILLFAIGLPAGLLVVLFLGHWQMYRAAKPQEYINYQKGSLVGYKPYNAQVRTLRVLEQINNKIKLK